MLDDFISFWTKSSQQWNGNTNVIGYELINEPFAGTSLVRYIISK
jgi:aryl-phospho-beta-D-glucosidase BglC (GH1 family)